MANPTSSAFPWKYIRTLEDPWENGRNKHGIEYLFLGEELSVSKFSLYYNEFKSSKISDFYLSNFYCLYIKDPGFYNCFYDSTLLICLSDLRFLRF